MVNEGSIPSLTAKGVQSVRAYKRIVQWKDIWLSTGKAWVRIPFC